MLGVLALARNGAAVDLPASRKVRALFAYLALAPRPVPRTRLCDLLWDDAADDPRGELRWCLAKLRALLKPSDRDRIESAGDALQLDLDDADVDALIVAAATERGLDSCDDAELRALATRCGGAFMDGLEFDRCPEFNAWLAGQRRRFRDLHAAILAKLAVRCRPEEALPVLEQWVALTPFDLRAQAALLQALAASGRPRDGERHLAAAAKLFEAEEQDFHPVREAWRAARSASAPATCALTSEPAPIRAQPIRAMPNRAALAVMPFRELDDRPVLPGGSAAGLTYDIIARLAKLRHFFVIAQGSVFALAERSIGPEEAGRRLGVDYVASGTIRRRDDRLLVTVELIETGSARILWSEAFDRRLDDLFAVLDEIGDSIVSSIAAEIETVEKSSAILKPPSSLTAWEAYHRGLWHMYRFTREENAAARQFFRQAIRLDPTFARAHAGLSFTHWQSAFQRWEDHVAEAARAHDAAAESLLADDRDPVAHWAMGRALWLADRPDDSLAELKNAVALSPNFALGHYAVSFVESQSGDPTAAISASDHSRQLSPFDPLLFGMLGTRALALARLGDYEASAEWALKAAARPNAHANIRAIALHCLALAGRLDEARAQFAAIRKARPDYCADDFFAAFRFQPEAEALFRAGAARIGLG
ncbi:MAG TPA: transcriptional regulator [Candidatus Binatia bacterium]|nr:transcriptional regulator [Candidatus Binatia bacterium]